MFPPSHTISFSAKINAPRDTVWFVLTDKAFYRNWGLQGEPGSYIIGDWREGEEMRFVNRLGTGIMREVTAVKPRERLHSKLTALLMDEDVRRDMAAAWGNGRENFDLAEKNGKTVLRVEADVAAAFLDDLKPALKNSLQLIKEIAEELADSKVAGAVAKKVYDVSHELLGLNAWPLVSFVNINAPRELVWSVLTDKVMFKHWNFYGNKPRFVGDWSEGSEMRFADGNKGGARIIKVVSGKPCEQLHLKHLRIAPAEGAEYDIGDEWGEKREHYDLAEENGVTRLRAELDIATGYHVDFVEILPGALQRVKQLAEILAKGKAKPKVKAKAKPKAKAKAKPAA